jgi:localization factor PodJL
VEGLNLAEMRGSLLKAARALVAENPGFTVTALMTAAGVSRAEFRRCFSSKQALLAALAEEEVKDLSNILEAAQPAAQTLRQAVGAETVPVPQTDAWLERRLRVFERALAGLEKRQELFEQKFTQSLELLEERFGVLSAAAEIADAVSPEPEATPQATPEPAPVATQTTPESVAKPVPPTADGESPIDLAPALLARVEEIADADEAAQPVSEDEMAAFLAQARLAAQKAAAASSQPKPRPRRTRLLAASGAALAILLLLVAGVLIASGALGHAAPAIADGGVSHRHLARQGLPRLVALADSGDPAAQTALALAYLRGQDVPGDQAAARRWSLAAAAQGQPVAQYLLGTLYLADDRQQGEAVRWFDAAARQGNIKAMHNLAVIYAKGIGVSPDMAVAASWFGRAAALGYRDSQFDLAVLYERGLGVPQNVVLALKWYLVAAAGGDAPSAARATVLQGQMLEGEALKAHQEAAAFAPEPAGDFANQAPSL